ncbi:MAG: hypothetical protein ACR2PA_21180 [Hyphomicrobiaceae bacterium]
MGALAHYIEAAGLATTQISLIRLHTEKTRPPRALWVSFELGRPLGVPDDAAFQHRVLRAALDLLDHPGGPVLVDYPEDAPPAEAADMDGWVCPMPVRAPPDASQDPTATLHAEISSLRQWHDLFRERRGRTSVGASGRSIDDIASYLARMLADGRPGPADGSETPAQLLKLGSEDIKAFYSEAALAMPGNKSARQIADWLWLETELGRTLLALRPVCLESDDKAVKRVGQVTLVPHAYLHHAKAT